MPSVFEKLNLKQQREILVVNAPSTFGSSGGADEMVALARHHGKPMYFSLADIPHAS